MARLVIRSLSAGLIAGMVAACSGGTGSSRPDGPGWSLNDTKPQRLGYASAAPASAQNSSASPYEYRGGRDPVTGQAIQPTPPPQAQTSPPLSPRAALRLTQSPTPSGPAQHVEVRKGDTLHGLSLQHHVSVPALMAANNLTSAKIMPGQKLLLPPQL
jgi:LysM repeat protein